MAMATAMRCQQLLLAHHPENPTTPTANAKAAKPYMELAVTSVKKGLAASTRRIAASNSRSVTTGRGPRLRTLDRALVCPAEYPLERATR